MKEIKKKRILIFPLSEKGQKVNNLHNLGFKGSVGQCSRRIVLICEAVSSRVKGQAAERGGWRFCDEADPLVRVCPAGGSNSPSLSLM